MMKLPKIIQEAVEQLELLPGLGERTALRHVLHMCYWNPEKIRELASRLNQLSHLNQCSECGAFSNNKLCDICAHPDHRQYDLLCVVENFSDVIAIERGGDYCGFYHILGGVLNPLLGIGPEELRIDALVDRVKKSQVSEVILAINPSIEGEATCSYLKQVFPKEIKIERIGFGIPMGGNLEYLDNMTISKALENRTQL